MFDPDSIELPHNAIVFSNARLRSAIVDVRIQGRTSATIGEVYDALSQRRRIRDQYRAQYREWQTALSNRISAEAASRSIWELQAQLKSARISSAKFPEKRRGK